jgi:NADH-ubiquinone oxidoreductase chain 1
MTIYTTIISILAILSVLVPILMVIAFVTIAERKIMGSMQRRCGPNAVGFYGLLQPFADALKLLFKEIIIPRQSNNKLFIIGPFITLIFSLLGWSVIPYAEGITIFDFELGVLVAIAIASIGSYGILISGWAANSKYAFFGSIRSTAQLLSYELVLSSIIFLIIIFAGSLSFTLVIEAQKVIWFIFPLLPIALMFFIAILAETNRPPFDLPEAESELVAGFMTEHSASVFVFFFLGEYSSLILMSALMTVFFLGGYISPELILPWSMEHNLDINIINTSYNVFGTYQHIIFTILDKFEESFTFGFKIIIIVFLFIWVRASFPRLRYDQLMSLCWKALLPLVFSYIIFTLSLLYVFNMFPLPIY